MFKSQQQACNCPTVMQEDDTVVLVDVPDQAFTDDFGKAVSDI